VSLVAEAATDATAEVQPSHERLEDDEARERGQVLFFEAKLRDPVATPDDLCFTGFH
jgi:hypothetical protein